MKIRLSVEVSKIEEIIYDVPTEIEELYKIDWTDRTFEQDWKIEEFEVSLFDKYWKSLDNSYCCANDWNITYE